MKKSIKSVIAVLALSSAVMQADTKLVNKSGKPLNISVVYTEAISGADKDISFALQPGMSYPSDAFNEAFNRRSLPRQIVGRIKGIVIYNKPGEVDAIVTSASEPVRANYKKRVVDANNFDNATVEITSASAWTPGRYFNLKSKGKDL